MARSRVLGRPSEFGCASIVVTRLIRRFISGSVADIARTTELGDESVPTRVGTVHMGQRKVGDGRDLPGRVDDHPYLFEVLPRGLVEPRRPAKVGRQTRRVERG